jgi:hypothetical protein
MSLVRNLNPITPTAPLDIDTQMANGKFPIDDVPDNNGNLNETVKLSKSQFKDLITKFDTTAVSNTPYKIGGIAAGTTPAALNARTTYSILEDILLNNTGGGTYTDEEIQDLIGAMFTDSATIDFTYDDGAGTLTAIVIDNSITFSKMQTIGDNTVIGNVSGATAIPSAISIIVSDTLTGASNNTLADSLSLKNYIDNSRNTRNAVAVDIPTPLASTITALPNTDYFTVSLTEDITITAVSGIIKGKTYLLYVDNDTPTSPHQITFDSGAFSLDDGVIPFFKSITAGIEDVVELIGISPTKLQIADIRYGS